MAKMPPDATNTVLNSPLPLHLVEALMTLYVPHGVDCMLLAQFASMLAEFIVFDQSPMYVILEMRIDWTATFSSDYASVDLFFQNGLDPRDNELLSILRAGRIQGVTSDTNTREVWPPDNSLTTSLVSYCTACHQTEMHLPACTSLGKDSLCVLNPRVKGQTLAQDEVNGAQ